MTSILQEEKQFSKNFCHISPVKLNWKERKLPVQFVYDQEKAAIWVSPSFRSDIFEGPRQKLKLHSFMYFSIVCNWSITLNKVFIGIGRMKLNHDDFSLFGSLLCHKKGKYDLHLKPGHEFCQCLSNETLPEIRCSLLFFLYLACSRRAIEYYLHTLFHKFISYLSLLLQNLYILFDGANI